MLGQVPLSAAEPSEEFLTILGWADAIRKGKLKVRANADTGADAANARHLGAEGIGLCRTEHMFLAEDRLPIVRRMILADTPEEEKAALEELRVAQRADFLSILEAMDGLPVTVRLLDPPLHEFLPRPTSSPSRRRPLGWTPRSASSTRRPSCGRSPTPCSAPGGPARGPQAGPLPMQVSALMEAATHRVVEGGHPIIEVMIPLTVSGPELALARRWVEEAVAGEFDRGPAPPAGVEVTIGTMIETPGRRCGRRDRRSRRLLLVRDQRPDPDDIRLQPRRRRRPDDVGIPGGWGCCPATPLRWSTPMGSANWSGRRERGGPRPDLKIGVCGEHGGDPASIPTFYEAGLDYVSCSPFRVPVARLAAPRPSSTAGRPSRHGPRPGASPPGAGAKLAASQP